MRKYARQSVISVLAPTKWALAPAVLYGLIHGLTLLNESVDLATALGIASFISLAIGPWLAVNLDRLLMRGYTAWMTAIVGKLTTLEASMPVGREPAEQDRAGSQGVGVVTRTVGYSFFATIFCFGGLTSGALLTIATAQIQGLNHGPYLVATAAMFVALVCTIMAQCLYFGIMHRRVDAIEAQCKLTGAPAPGSSPVTIQAAILCESIARTEQFGCRVVGARPIAVK